MFNDAEHDHYIWVLKEAQQSCAEGTISIAACWR